MEIRELAKLVTALDAVLALAKDRIPDHQYDILVSFRNAVVVFITLKNDK